MNALCMILLQSWNMVDVLKLVHINVSVRNHCQWAFEPLLVADVFSAFCKGFVSCEHSLLRTASLPYAVLSMLHCVVLSQLPLDDG